MESVWWVFSPSSLISSPSLCLPSTDTNFVSQMLALPTPLRVAALQGKLVRSVTCGAHSSACITEHGDLYQWGKKVRFAVAAPPPCLPYS